MLKRLSAESFFIIYAVLLCSGQTLGDSKTSEMSDRSWPCATHYLQDHPNFVRLVSNDILARVKERRPIRVPSEGKFTGNVELEAIIGISGRVECARGKTGNALALSAAMESFRTWKFHPLMRHGKRAAAFGGTVDLSLDSK